MDNNFFDYLPQEITREIMVKCQDPELYIMSFVCKLFKQMIGATTNDNICIYAATKNYFGILQWAYDNGCVLKQWTINYAASRGNLEMIKWLLQDKCEYNNYICANAAANGHLKVLKWFYSNKYEIRPSTYTYAKRNGHLEILEWLQSIDIELNKLISN